MKEKISSNWTYFYKRIWILLLFLFGLFLFFGGFDAIETTCLLLFGTISFLVALQIDLELKVVEIDENNMYVSDKGFSIQIPLYEIKDVRYFSSIFHKLVITVVLRNETKFGSTIKFVPYLFFGWIFFEHPIINKLKQLAKLDKNS